MMSYKNYSVEDFLADESFQQYCSGTNESAVTSWNKILEEEPQIGPTFKEAIDLYNLLNAGQGNLQQQTERLQKRIHDFGQKVKVIKQNSRYNWWAAAAIFFLLLSAGGYVYFNSSSQKQVAKTETQKQNKNDIEPGGNRAVLTLADGKQIVLDSINNGTLTQQGNTKIIKLNDGQLAYNAANTNGEILYNTISTPKGGQYQIVLADGSKVWLNAASSLRFPASFTGNERNVELTGEGYFEIAKNAQKPFHVKVNDMEVEVLGTHFNVNAYSDEAAIKTTLLEGSVKVSTGKEQQSIVIKPGQQVQLQTNHNLQTINNVDINHEVAWKDGLFDFDNDNITDIMHQLERWYNVDIEYAGKVPQTHYTGSIRRAVNISQVLNILEIAGGADFTIEENKIIIKSR